MFFPVWPIVLLILLPIVVSCILAVVRACTLPRGMSPAPVCGHCGYLYTGWTRCPECGAELLSAGLLTPRLSMKLRGSLVGAAIALFVLLVTTGSVVGVVGLAAFSMMGYKSLSGTSTFSFASVPTTTYNVNAAIEIEQDPGGVPLAGELVLQLVTRAAPTRVVIDARTGTCRVIDATGQVMVSETPFDENASTKLFRAAGLDTANAATATSARDLVSLVAAIRASGWKPGAMAPVAGLPGTAGSLQQGNSTTSSGFATPVRLFGLSSSATWWSLISAITLAVCVAALVFVVKRRALLLRPTSPHPAPAPPSPQAATDPPPDSLAAGRS